MKGVDQDRKVVGGELLLLLVCNCFRIGGEKEKMALRCNFFVLLYWECARRGAGIGTH